MIVPDIIEDFLNQISWDLRIVSFSDDTLNTTLVLDRVLYAREGLQLQIDNVPYTIVSVDYSTNTIVLEGVIAMITDQAVLLDAPIFLHGTPYMTNRHFTRAKQVKERMTPLIYLLEIINREDEGLESIVERMDLRMFFLDDARADWLTNDHYSEVIIPMDNLAEYVQEQMYNYIAQFVPNTFSIRKTDHVNFGEYKTLKGHLQSIFDARLSGVERLFRSFSINKPCDC